MTGMDQRSPARNRVQTPVNEYAELGIGIPLRKRMLVERLQGRFVVRWSGLKERWEPGSKAEERTRKS